LVTTVSVRFHDGRQVACPFHTEVKDLIAREPADPSGLPYLGALVNNELVSLAYPIEADCEIRPVTLTDPHGWRIYVRSAAFLLAKATRDVLPQARLSISYSVGTGLYCICDAGCPQNDQPGIAPEQVARIEARLRDLVRSNVPILRRKLPLMQALAHFERTGMRDCVSLLKYRNPPRVVIHSCEDFHDLAQGPIVAAAGQIQTFALIPHPPGFILQLPDRRQPHTVPPFDEQPHLFRIFNEHIEWGRILGVETVGALNDLIAAGQARELIQTAEALHEKKVAHIADAIQARGRDVKLILISGPSSAGKTTFAKRLAIQLRVNGRSALTIALDDYFHERERTPRDTEGGYDFEHIEALDRDLFNRQMLALLRGEEIEPPTFNFETKRREFRGAKLRLAEEQIVIVEGIHGLNPDFTRQIPESRKFKIYVSALTQLKIDSCNRISTTDNRLLRRLVRDHQFRGHNALDTIRMWPSVRRGEERWIFPYQTEADVFFNSALDYELAALKPLAEPLLMQIKPSQAEYAEARRLTAFLMNFLAIPEREVPSTSILREYIGRSGFRYS
jgi:uridine kinase